MKDKRPATIEERLEAMERRAEADNTCPECHGKGRVSDVADGYEKCTMCWGKEVIEND